jgi:GNAT superfamily N-acetyltransferase
VSTGASSAKREIDLSKVVYGPFDFSKSRAAFCCGNERIDNFFRNNAKKQHLAHKVRVYTATYENEIIGYYYLVATSNPPDHVSEEAFAKFGRVNSTPCVYLGMIGVDLPCASNGVGKVLMIHAMEKTLEIAELVGIYALTLDALDEKTAERYGRWGFQKFVEGELAMFLPLGTIRSLLEGAKPPAKAQTDAVLA